MTVQLKDPAVMNSFAYVFLSGGICVANLNVIYNRRKVIFCLNLMTAQCTAKTYKKC